MLCDADTYLEILPEEKRIDKAPCEGHTPPPSKDMTH